MRKKIALCFTIVIMLALSVPAVGIAGPVEDVNHEAECIAKMVEMVRSNKPLQEKLDCILKCAKHKIDGKCE